MIYITAKAKCVRNTYAYVDSGRDKPEAPETNPSFPLLRFILPIYPP